ncbi:DUF4176 domain-containing protein [Bombilactobacillus thymidiniphilus]|uniref:DUF4176 domain-containing protein n=1 Tax=Bombilactobacillus thymidiniphilus TaxID=2923363 RepID=A0ABY4PCQ3_9LACO|nr:DUF4176 domain-containing protein [Bombilactobacillus thymidiniphilus]UQS83052.1 DUF4176 domain-containing protein [Bombilactobacillus thymidiniphilus]
MNNLPVGSVVTLGNAKDLLMVVSRLPITTKDDEEVYFDYAGVPLPMGVISDEVLFFNDADINHVLSLGYVNEATLSFQESVAAWKKAGTVQQGTAYIK